MRFTTEGYHRLVEIGVLGADDRTELLNGEVFYKMPINSRHAGCVNRLVRLIGRLAESPLIASQNPIRLSNISEPEPDVAVLRFRGDDYSDSHPEPQDVLLLIEVADSSLAVDRSIKAPLYAAAGIPELWIVDLAGEALEVYQDPDPAGYRRYRRHVRGETVISSTLPALSLTVDEILGPAARGETAPDEAAPDASAGQD
ncbi:MAG: Uma2 family endonuclease [Ardenticatenia bacterium]|nr:Uma2 family endonuclease [Ardenticatenia bacterium]